MDLLSLAKGLRKLDAFSKTNLTRLGLVALFLTLVDNVQSYYGQKVINVFSEFNAIPALYYRHGIIGYVLYAPLEFSVVYTVMLVLWLWSSYVIWYHRNIVSKSHILARVTLKR